MPRLVKNVANAANEGQSIGGDGALGKILGVGFGVGTAVTEGMDTAEQSKQNGMFDFRSEQPNGKNRLKPKKRPLKRLPAMLKTRRQPLTAKRSKLLATVRFAPPPKTVRL